MLHISFHIKEIFVFLYSSFTLKKKQNKRFNLIAKLAEYCIYIQIVYVTGVIIIEVIIIL